jgi:NodT family efflux transporter outer membrane factor (OMF) lipoprotein
MARLKPHLGLAWLATILTGCTVGPNYHPPAVATPAAFGEAGSVPAGGADGAAPAHPAEAAALERWWIVFHDPELESLVERALRNNRDLRIAISRVREARAERQIAAAGLIPEVDASGGYNRSRGSKNVVLPLSSLAGSSAGPGGGPTPAAGATAAGGRPGIRPQEVTAGSGAASGSGSGAGASSGASAQGGPNTPFGEGGLPGVTTSLYQAGFDAVWEIDVFGGVRRAIQAADAAAAAARAGADGVRVTLAAEVATTYLQLRADQAREELAAETLGAQRETWKIAEDQFKSGVGDAIAVAQELAELHRDETALPPLLAAERISQHALAYLLGQDATALTAELSAHRGLPRLPDPIPVGVPSDLLRRRPDVRQAERQLAATSAQIGEATAALYPQFSLTGSFGWDSSNFKHLADWGSHYYSISPGISWPILDWAKLHAAIRVANEAQAQAMLAYQSAVAGALRDVEDALVQYEHERERRAALAAAVAQARRARQIAVQIYAAGLADKTAALQAARAVDRAEDALAQSDASLRVDLVSLYKALGGGWSVRS